MLTLSCMVSMYQGITWGIMADCNGDQACAKFRISELASIQFMNLNLNWIDSAPQEVEFEFELEWQEVELNSWQFKEIPHSHTIERMSHRGAQHNAFWLSKFVQIYLQYLFFPTCLVQLCGFVLLIQCILFCWFTLK